MYNNTKLVNINKLFLLTDLYFTYTVDNYNICRSR